jgi:hypothetical protein
MITRIIVVGPPVTMEVEMEPDPYVKLQSRETRRLDSLGTVYRNQHALEPTNVWLGVLQEFNA